MNRTDPNPIKIERPKSPANSDELSPILQEIYDRIEKIPTQLEILDKIKYKINQLQDTIDSKLNHLIGLNEKIVHNETKLESLINLNENIVQKLETLIHSEMKLETLINLNENIVQKLETLIQINEKLYNKLDQKI